MIMPLFTLASAALCMVAYMMLAVDEQHQEFAVLRAIGAKPKFVVSVLAIQSIIVLAFKLWSRNIARHHNNFAYFDASTDSYKLHNLRDNRLASCSFSGNVPF